MQFRLLYCLCVCVHTHNKETHLSTESFLEESKVAVSSDVKLSQEDIHRVCLDRAEKFLHLYSQVFHTHACGQADERREGGKESGGMCRETDIHVCMCTCM